MGIVAFVILNLFGTGIPIDVFSAGYRRGNAMPVLLAESGWKLLEKINCGLLIMAYNPIWMSA